MLHCDSYGIFLVKLLSWQRVSWFQYPSRMTSLHISYVSHFNCLCIHCRSNKVHNETSKHPAMNLQRIMCTFKINTYSWDAMSMVNCNLVPFWDVFCCNALFPKKNPNSSNRFLILSVSKSPCRYHSCDVQCSGEHSLFNWRFKIMDSNISTDSYIAIIVNLYPSVSTM